MDKIRAEIKILSAGVETIDDITNLLVASGLPREKVLDIQAENDREWKRKYGMTAEEMIREKMKKVMNRKKHTDTTPCGERLHKLLKESSEELRQEIVAFLEEGKKKRKKSWWKRKEF